LVNINGPTHGAEPNMPFGGFGASGNGTREAGIESLNYYSDQKIVATFNTIT
jgi:aldehyde dehydrogenase (NAD+)